MKFGKSLSNQIEQTLPEWRDKFLSYKDLKKRLKLIDSKSVDRPTKRLRLDESSVGMSKEEISFIQLLEDELEKFNNFFVEKEEEYIIRLKVKKLIKHLIDLGRSPAHYAFRPVIFSFIYTGENRN